MAQELPDRLKGAKSLPDGKVQLRDGTVMSRAAWMNRKYGSTPLVQITGQRTTARKAAVTRKEKAVEKGMAKRAARDIKKGNKTDPFSNPSRVTKRDTTPAKTTARMAAAERAKAVPPSQRTAAQTRAIKSESRVRIESEWRKMAADAKRSAKEIKAAAKAPKAPRTGRPGLRGFGGGGGLFGTKNK
jgi:hypothetical protein